MTFNSKLVFDFTLQTKKYETVYIRHKDFLISVAAIYYMLPNAQVFNSEGGDIHNK